MRAVSGGLFSIASSNARGGTNAVGDNFGRFACNTWQYGGAGVVGCVTTRRSCAFVAGASVMSTITPVNVVAADRLFIAILLSNASHALLSSGRASALAARLGGARGRRQ